ANEGIANPRTDDRGRRAGHARQGAGPRHHQGDSAGSRVLGGRHLQALREQGGAVPV
ncbi:MAG: Transcriptional regulator, AcrR family, partial [uncultured Rubrobacteraceae bacterium]